MTFETRQAYSEVCAVLEYMPDEYVKKIPEAIEKINDFAFYGVNSIESVVAD